MAPSTRSAHQGGVESRSSSLSSERRTPRDEPVEQEEDALAALQERIATVKKRRDELLALQQLRELEEEVARLEEYEQNAPPAGERDNVSRAQDLATRRQGAAEPTGSTYTKRTLKPKDPAEYRGKTIKEHREFVRSCEVAFRLLPQEFDTNRDKVIWSMQYMGGEPRELWYAHFERTFEARGEIPTWEYFKQYLLDLLSDPINRSLEAATAHSHAMQRKDQTVRSFATYLDVLEDQLTAYTEEQRVQHLFTKLRPELQRAITNYHQIPATREDLIALASTLERNLRRAPPAHDQPTRSAHKEKRRGASPPLPQRSLPKKPKDNHAVTCFKCQKKGHYANECRSNNPNQLPVNVNKTGKGQASLRSRDQ
jgi:hypothetical protein